jgi:hypothetical protein
VQLSTAATTAQGLVESLMIVSTCTHCINTCSEGCRANCAYCGLARHREETRACAEHNLIRVDWPVMHYEEIISSPRCSITVSGADARSGCRYFYRGADAVNPEIMDRLRVGAESTARTSGAGTGARLNRPWKSAGRNNSACTSSVANHMLRSCRSTAPMME